MTRWLIEFTRSRVKKTLVLVHDLHFHATNNILFANCTYLQYPNTDPEGLFLTTVTWEFYCYLHVHLRTQRTTALSTNLCLSVVQSDVLSSYSQL